jgi:hypothetical protein
MSSLIEKVLSDWLDASKPAKGAEVSGPFKVSTRRLQYEFTAEQELC